ncbi:hypothetical protein EVAR_27185_1 [Eumeta japonica]|uniref:Uncharacterized protein n=1 Tax=Eumeta variegata TaxID=151549 RepID=A0A4C1VXM1_EUMVA|nr:hypothetical protein EVAR_27185_1 [Eumeta japonica]
MLNQTASADMVGTPTEHAAARYLCFSYYKVIGFLPIPVLELQPFIIHEGIFELTTASYCQARGQLSNDITRGWVLKSG